MNVAKALATIAGAAVAFGVVGTGIGVFLGKMAPSFLRYAVRAGGDATLEPMELGIGLGLTNGLTWGMVTGMVVVAILTWKEVRRAKHESASHP